MIGTQTLRESSMYNLGSITRIPPGEGRTFEIAQKTVAVFRTRSGDVVATQATCPHRQGPLADGITGGGKVVCPYHSYKFDLYTGRSVGNECEALTTYQVTVSETGDILLNLDLL